MNTKEHALAATRTLPDLGEELRNITLHYFNDANALLNEREALFYKKIEVVGVKLNLVHMVLGLAGELGEIVNCTGTQLKLKIDLPNLKEELGDIYWYLSNYCTLRNVPIPDSHALKINIQTDDCFELLISSISDLVDLVKRYVAYGKDIEIPKEYETVYDIYSALFMFETTYNIDGDEIRQKNIDKLKKRYPEKFSNDLAINRDLDSERSVFES